MKTQPGAALLLGMGIFLACTPPRFERAVVTINDRTLRVEVARSERARRRGLMFRKEFRNADGMLFVFDEENFYGFWMKNTSLPLEIVFIGASGKIVDLDSMAPFDTTRHFALAPFRCALELPMGSLERFSIKIGDTVRYRMDARK